MKKILFILSLSILAFSAPMEAQYSRTKNAEAIEVLQIENEELAAQVAVLETANGDIQTKLDSIKSNVEHIISDGKENVKVPTTVEEANELLVYILSFVMFILTGFIPKDKLPSWLTPFVVSIVVGLGITVFAYFASAGEFTIAEAVTFFLSIAGGSNILHQIKKPKESESANLAPAR